MKQELFDKAEKLLGGVSAAQYALDGLKCYSPDRACVIKIGSEVGGAKSVYIEDELADQIIKLARDYYEKKKSRLPKAIRRVMKTYL